jgi:hypothetical protein
VNELRDQLKRLQNSMDRLTAVIGGEVGKPQPKEKESDEDKDKEKDKGKKKDK